MKISEIVGRYFTVRRCACCGELLAYEERNEAFCADCREKFWRSLVTDCPTCGKPACECVCVPPILKKAGVEKVVSLAPYDPNGDGLPLHNAVLRLKDNRLPRVEKYMALRLAPPILKRFAEKGTDRADAVISYLPRSKKAIAESGVDQAKNLALALSAALGVPCVTLLERSSDGKDRKSGSQKKKTAAERAAAAKTFYRLKAENAEKLRGKTVLLADDVVTTGSSLAAGTRILRKAGAADVLPVCLALTRRRIPKKAIRTPRFPTVGKGRNAKNAKTVKYRYGFRSFR